MRPSDASRPARLSALAAPFWRSRSTAFSTLPLVSSSARLQSIIPAPVRARSSATSFAGMSFTVATSLTPHEIAALAPYGRERAAFGYPTVGGAGVLAFAPAARFGRRRRLLGLEPGRDRLGLGPPLAAGRLLLLVSLSLRLHAGLRGVRHALALFGRLAQRRLPARLPDQVRDRGRDERNGTDRVVIAGDRHGDQVRVRVRIHDRDHRDAELVRLRHRDTLLLRVHHEQCAREPAHVLDAGEVLLELQTLAVEQQLLFLGVVLDLTFVSPLLQILQPLDLLLDRLEVRERTTQPALGHVERAAAPRLRLEDVLELLLGADEQDALTLQHHAAQQLLRGLDLTKGLLQVDDVDAGAFGEDEPPHLRIPATRL